MGHPWLIVGQGLAGTTLALELIQRGQNIHIVDADLPGSSSAVAAGAYNPVTGKRMQLTWNAHVLWPVLEDFYPKAEAILGAKFFFQLPNIRPLFTEKDRIEAEKYTRNNTLGPWVEAHDTPNWHPQDQVVAPFGVLLVPKAGFVDVRAYCQAARAYFQANNLFSSSHIHPTDVATTQDGVTVDGVHYAGIIWADGYRGAQNPLQQNLPLAPLKGEILRLQAAPAPALAGGVLNRAAYLAPRPDGTLWAGSTYEHHYTTPHPTPEGAASILERVGKFFTPQLTVIEHLAGIRPSVLDRRPIIGLLPEHAHQYVYTGMGTKGVSLAPWLARLLVDNLLHQTPIPQEVAVRTLAHPQAHE